MLRYETSFVFLLVCGVSKEVRQRSRFLNRRAADDTIVRSGEHILLMQEEGAAAAAAAPGAPSSFSEAEATCKQRTRELLQAAREQLGAVEDEAACKEALDWLHLKLGELFAWQSELGQQHSKSKCTAQAAVLELKLAQARASTIREVQNKAAAMEAEFQRKLEERMRALSDESGNGWMGELEERGRQLETAKAELQALRSAKEGVDAALSMTQQLLKAAEVDRDRGEANTTRLEERLQTQQAATDELKALIARGQQGLAAALERGTWHGTSPPQVDSSSGDHHSPAPLQRISEAESSAQPSAPPSQENQQQGQPSPQQPSPQQPSPQQPSPQQPRSPPSYGPPGAESPPARPSRYLRRALDENIAEVVARLDDAQGDAQRRGQALEAALEALQEGTRALGVPAFDGTSMGTSSSLGASAPGGASADMSAYVQALVEALLARVRSLESSSRSELEQQEQRWAAERDGLQAERDAALAAQTGLEAEAAALRESVAQMSDIAAVASGAEDALAKAQQLESALAEREATIRRMETEGAARVAALQAEHEREAAAARALHEERAAGMQAQLERAEAAQAAARAGTSHEISQVRSLMARLLADTRTQLGARCEELSDAIRAVTTSDGGAWGLGTAGEEEAAKEVEEELEGGLAAAGGGADGEGAPHRSREESMGSMGSSTARGVAPQGSGQGDAVAAEEEAAALHGQQQQVAGLVKRLAERAVAMRSELDDAHTEVCAARFQLLQSKGSGGGGGPDSEHAGLSGRPGHPPRPLLTGLRELTTLALDISNGATAGPEPTTVAEQSIADHRDHLRAENQRLVRANLGLEREARRVGANVKAREDTVHRLEAEAERLHAEIAPAIAALASVQLDSKGPNRMEEVEGGAPSANEPGRLLGLAEAVVVHVRRQEQALAARGSELAAMTQRASELRDQLADAEKQSARQVKTLAAEHAREVDAMQAESSARLEEVEAAAKEARTTLINAAVGSLESLRKHLVPTLTSLRESANSQQAELGGGLDGDPKSTAIEWHEGHRRWALHCTANGRWDHLVVSIDLRPMNVGGRTIDTKGARKLRPKPPTPPAPLRPPPRLTPRVRPSAPRKSPRTVRIQMPNDEHDFGPSHEPEVKVPSCPSLPPVFSAGRGDAGGVFPSVPWRGPAAASDMW